MTLGPLPPVPQHIKVSITGTTDATDAIPWAVVLYFRYTGGPPAPADVAALAADIITAWTAWVPPLQNTSIVMRDVVVTDLSSTSGAEAKVPATVAGTRAGVQQPANVAVLVSYPVVTRYKGGHPRTYLLAGVAGDTLNASQWTAAFVTNVTTDWRSFLTAVIGSTSGTTTIAALSAVRYYGKFLPNSGPPRYRLTTPVASDLVVNQATVDVEMASQRRRIGRRKR